MIVWIDGRLHPGESARIDPRDRGFTLGDGLYETMRVKDGAVTHPGKHMARLRAGLETLRYAPSARAHLASGTLDEAIQSVIEANRLTDAALRLTITRGAAARGMLPDPDARPTIVVSASPYAPPAPARLIFATLTRRNEHSPLSRIKSTNCLDSVLARIEAADRGADDAILLNGAGRIAETSAANIFAVIDGVLVTPPVAEGALPGVMRGFVMEQAKVSENRLERADLLDAEEIFLTSSLGIRPAVELEGRSLSPGPVATKLIAAS